MPEPHTVFLLSPARLDGKRASLLLRQNAGGALAERIRTPGGAEIGDVFSFISQLYFRGKLACARSFGPTAGVHAGISSTSIITTDGGLVPAATRVAFPDLEAMAVVDAHVHEPRFVEPPAADAKQLAGMLAGGDRMVLLGSIAGDKYVRPWLAALAAVAKVTSDRARALNWYHCGVKG